jgi:hypothetical protein
VWADGVYRVEISDGEGASRKRRVPLFAQVDPTTGKVALYVEREHLKRLTENS